jgi:hypothetical protein
MFSIDENGRSAASSDAAIAKRALTGLSFFWKTRGAIPDSVFQKNRMWGGAICLAASRETLQDGRWSEDRVPSGPDLVDEPRRAVCKNGR